MTQKSFPWGCTNTGDGGPSSFSLDVVYTTNMLLNNVDPSSDGVIWWKSGIVLPFAGFVNASDGLLKPTNPSGNTVRIASGIGMVQGWLHASDANADFDVSGGNASATDIIVLRRDASGQTVRLAHKRGAASSVATVTQTAATWEVKIAEVVLDGSGNFSSLNDVRQLCRPPVGAWVPIETLEGDGTDEIVFDEIPPFFTNLLITGNGRSTYPSVPIDTFSVYFNGDSSSYYTIKWNVNFSSSTNVVASKFSGAANQGAVTTDDASAIADIFDPVRIEVFNYSHPGINRNAHITSVARGDNSDGTVQKVDYFIQWGNTDVVNQIALTLFDGNWNTSSKFTLWGILA